MARIVERFEGRGISPGHPSHQVVGMIGHDPPFAQGDACVLGKARTMTVEAVRQRLAHARSIFMLTGSGISADSGLPTFRGVGGLWRSHRVEELASARGFERDPVLVWTWYNERIGAHRRARPNAGHYALATMGERLPDVVLATQNVDSLHLRAGSRNVAELHGALRSARCTTCAYRRPLDALGLPIEEIEHDCGGRLRPDIVWFGEPLPSEPWERAVAAAARAELVLIVGTSAVVYPAAALATRYAAADAFVVEVNPEASALSGRVDVVLRDTAARVLPALVGGDS